MPAPTVAEGLRRCDLVHEDVPALAGPGEVARFEVKRCAVFRREGVGYVLEGQIRFAIDHETPLVLRRGEMFYEPAGALHSTSENAQPGMPAKILAFMVAPPGRPVVEGK